MHRNVMGIAFSNPVGLAAGFDKNASLYNELSNLGFGFIEVGTVTPLPQPGNEKPRMFRLPDDEALINRMGFNNDGVVEMVKKLKSKNKEVIIGGNIGRNKLTANDNAVEDYEKCFRALFPYVNYFVVNVSSPNTPGLRELQEKKPLLNLLQKLQDVNYELSGNNSDYKQNSKPILLKIAPDLTETQLDEIIDVVHSSGINGVVATNTTLSRTGLKSDKNKIISSGAGGLSGKPLMKRSTDIIRYLRKKGGNGFIIIGSGGILSAADAVEKLNAGADLIQLYTGFIYEGPELINQINRELIKLNGDRK